MTALLERGAPASAITDVGAQAPTVRLVRASDVRAQPVRWLWRSWLPLGSVSVLAGREGLGKSQLLAERAARVTRGELPGDVAAPADVVFASLEDDTASVLVPRLLAAGADLTRCHVVRVEDAMGEAPLALPRGLGQLADVVEAADARLLIVDPVIATLIDAGVARDTDVRRVLGPLAQLAERRHLAVVAVLHLSKALGGEALQRVAGPIGFTAAARSVLLFGKDPDAIEGEVSGRRVLGHAKCNVGPLAGSLRVTIVSAEVPGGDRRAIATSRAIVEGSSEATADDLVRGGDSMMRRAEAAAGDFLLAELRAGEVLTRDLKSAAGEAGHSWRTVERAKARLPVAARKVGTRWAWSLTTGEDAHGGAVGLAPESAETHAAARDSTPHPPDGVPGGDASC